MMSGIRGKNTKPELTLRHGLHRKGFRYRVHDKTLPGKPDIVFPRWNAVILAHGCFWHGHDCPLFRLPSTRPDFWKAKIARNREIDNVSAARLKKAGWRQAVVWECALKGPGRRPQEEIIDRCAAWLTSGKSSLVIAGDYRWRKKAHSRITSKA
jgi:DNA mismatch endonuclease (patch repair protein)